MELMPHIKALLDDLISMTSKIVVKRTDLANRYENNNRNNIIYAQYRDIMYSTTTFYTYKVYPKEVLEKYTKWDEFNDDSFRLKLLPRENNTDITTWIDGKYTTISNTKPTKMGLENYVWVTYKDNGKFYPITQYNDEEVDHSFSLLNYNEDGSIDLNNVVSSISMETFRFDSIKNLKLYIYDKQFDQYVEVDYNIDSEFVPTSDPINTTYTYETKNGKKSIYLRNHMNKGEYLLKDSNYKLPPDETYEEYYFRYKINITYTSSDYYETNVYLHPETAVDSRYTKVGIMQYYYDGDMYYPLYTQSNNGSYAYDSETDTFIDISGLDPDDEEDQKILNKYNISDFYDIADVSEELKSDIYCYYEDANASIVTRKTFTVGSSTMDRYVIDNKTGIFKLYYTYSDNTEDLKECVIYDMITTSKNIWYSYNLPNIETGEYDTYYSSDIANKYYFYQDDVLGTYKKENNSYVKIVGSYSGTRYSYSTTQSESLLSYNLDECMYYNENAEMYISDRVFTNDEVSQYYKYRDSIPEEYRDDLTELMREYIINLYCPTDNSGNFSVPRYIGETNDYYRELNGLPPTSPNVYNPMINRYEIDPDYKGDTPNAYFYDLTDKEVSIIEKSGLLKKYQDAYPKLGYLKHLGKNRIDVLVAREAEPYDILSIGDYDIPISYRLFKTNYDIARSYIFKRYYQNNMFGKHEYYNNYIGFLICVVTMMLCISKSGDLLIENRYMDADTVDMVLKSYGFENTFNKIPLIYRRNIAKSIMKLILNKGIDSIYSEVYKIFNMDDVEVYKYYYKKYINSDGTSDISLAQVPINSNNIIRELIERSNFLDYDDITSSDKYWGVYESNESVKEKIKNILFNYMDSKYISINNKFDLTELNFNSSYLLNYLIESTVRNNIDITIDVDEISTPQRLQDLIIMLFAIQAIKFRFDGNIPSDIIQAASIYKFNLDTEVAGENGTMNKIINKYYDYMTISERSNVNDIKNMANTIINTNVNTGSIAGVIYNDSHDENVTELTETYLMNVSADDVLTKNVDEDSLLNQLIQLRNNAKTIEDFRCYDELIHCISICDELKNIYKFKTPVWENMIEYTFDISKTDNESIIDKTVHGIDISNYWSLLSDTDKNGIMSNEQTDRIPCYRLIDDTYIPVTEYDSEIHVRYDDKEYYRYFSNYMVLPNKPMRVYNEVFAIVTNDVTRSELMSSNIGKDLDNTLYDRLDVYEYINILSYYLNSGIEDLYQKASLNIYQYVTMTESKYPGVAICGVLPIEEFMEKIKTTSLNDAEDIVYLYLYKDSTNSNIIHGILYKKCTSALTYEMYLREMAPALYEYLQYKQNETYDERLERLSTFSSTIIATIEESIDDPEIRNIINLHYIDFENIIEYIKIVLNVFKSYTIDMSNMDIIYELDNKSNNNIKLIDDYYTNETYGLISNLHMHDNYSYDEESYNRDIMKIKDEIDIILMTEHTY